MNPDELREKLAQLNALRMQGVLSDDLYQAALKGLGIEPEPVDLRESQGGVYKPTAPVEQQFGDRYYYTTPPAPDVACDPTDALPCYLTHVIESNSRLQLQGIRSASGLVSIALEEVYVTLTATVRQTVREEEAWVAEMAKLAPGEAKRRPPFTSPLSGGIEGGPVQQVKVQVQEALALHPRLVVLGDPGCGKTTLLRYLALTYARDFPPSIPPTGGEAKGGSVQQRLGLDEHLLPILLPLRDFARYLEEACPDNGADGPKLLLDYLRLYFTNQNLTLPPDFFETRLAAGECSVLLDGLDEVASMATRQRVARIVERFTLAYPDNRYVVTSRIVGYTGGARLGADYAVTTVRDFTNEDIARFAHHWNRAVESVLAGGPTEYALRQAKTASDKLIAAIKSNARVRELAVNPLLLTVIALVQRYRAQLPERRTELYEEAIEVLLGKWDEAKGLDSKTQVVGYELDAKERRSMLEPVALWMMEQRLREIEAEELRQQLGERFYPLLGDWRKTGQAVDVFLRLIRERSGLLVERGQGIYTFSHLTFQEYLAARAVADREDYVAYTLARVGDSWWREVVLLEAGYLSTQGKRRATELIQAVLEHKQEPEPYHNLVLAAEALRDVGPVCVEGDLRGEIQHHLRQEFERPLRLSKKSFWNNLLGRQAWVADLIQRRAAAAEALGRIESGGFGAQPAFWTLPWGLPVWVEIPAGEFWMGSEKGDDDEKPVHKVHLERYWISRVPITNAQYRFFVADAGHRAPSHWEDGQIPRGKESHPVVNVTWHDALAYCQWLEEKLQVTSCRLKVWRATGVEIVNLQPGTFNLQLPSEAEWEKAARGGLSAPGRRGAGGEVREYPWGDKWREEHCNSKQLGVNDTTPVGIFPEGASPYGVLELAGNVLEWTRSHWKGYPYDPADGREALDAGDSVSHVLRGGSFGHNQYNARCACRVRNNPSRGWDISGFRVVVSPSRL